MATTTDEDHTAFLYRPERRTVLTVAVFAAGVGLTALATPLAVQLLVNTIAFGVLVQPLVVLSLLLLAALALNAAMRVVQQIVIERLQQRLLARAGVGLAHRLMRLDARALDREDGAEAVNRFLEVATVQKAAATLLVDGVSLGLQSLIGLVLLTFYHPVLLALAALIIAGVAAIVLVLGRGAVRTSVAESHAKYRLLAWLEELARGSRTFVALGREAQQYGEARAHALVRGYVGERQRHFRVLLRQIIGSMALEILAVVLLLGVGGWLVIERQLTLGQLVAAELVVTPVVAGLTKLGKQLETYYDLVAADDKLRHLFALPAERSDGAEPRRGEAGMAVTLAGVTAGYAAEPQLVGLDLTIAPGDLVAILGDTGSGKSLLAELLAGRRAPSRGTVVVDGVDLRSLELSTYRSTLAVVGEAEIFDGTIADNVAVGRAAVDAAAVRATLERIGLLAIVDSLAEGVHTRIGPGGVVLAAQPADQLMLARALAGRPRLVVVDGTLDRLSGDRQRAAMAALRAVAAEGSTVLVLTHDASVAAEASRRLLLDGGMLIAEGA